MIWQHMVSGCWQGGKDWASDGGERVLCYTRRCKHSTDSCVSRVCWQWPQPLSKTSTLCCPNLKPTTITSHLPERGKVSVPSASPPPYNGIHLFVCAQSLSCISLPPCTVLLFTFFVLFPKKPTIHSRAAGFFIKWWNWVCIQKVEREQNKNKERFADFTIFHQITGQIIKGSF